MALAGCIVFSSMALAQEPNTLTPQQTQDGWQLLFNGHDLNGWHSYLQKGTGKDWSSSTAPLAQKNQPAPRG